MIRPLLVVALALAAIGHAAGAVYYVDSDSGADENIGLSPRQAWRSLQKVNDTVFQAGDKVLFRRGTHYAGQLRPQGSGHAGEPVVIASYGIGDRPRIDGQGKVLDTVLIRNVEYWQVSELEVTNQGPEREPWRTGVRVVVEDYGTMHQIHLRDLYVHDVNGDLRKSREGCGIFFEARGSKNSHFDDLLIEDCHLVRTDRNGICQRRSGRAGRSVKVVIRGNLLEDIGGDAIKPWGSNGALVEYNTVRGGRMRCADAAAGIWPWDCDDTVIQFNEVSGMKGTRDGQAFDSDYLCRNTVFQYNYSHDNDGGFMLVCTPGNSYCEGTVIRYNVSQNDGIDTARVFHFGGGPKNTRIYNNVVYVAPGRDLPLLLFTDWSGGNAVNTYFYNNIFYVEGKVRYQWGKSKNNVFENNAFYGGHDRPPADPHAVTGKPPLLDPGSGTHGRNSLGGYLLREPIEEWKGRIIENNGGRDFFGNPVPEDQPAFRGVHQPRQITSEQAGRARDREPPR